MMMMWMIPRMNQRTDNSYHSNVPSSSTSSSKSSWSTNPLTITTPSSSSSSSSLYANKKISKERRKQLGILDSEDEYDLDVALDANTDPLITKIIAGSLIVTIIALLVVAVIIPFTTTYDEGICNPILNGGRC
jgi:hypothetical protein